MTATVATRWDHATALRAYRETMARISVVWDRMDAFERPSLHRRDILAADRAIQDAFRVHDTVALARALARWEAAICG